LFQGINTALITPLANGAVDFDALARLVDRQLEAGVHGLVICATTGEGSSLGDEERAKVVVAVVKRTAGRVPVAVGTGRVATWATIDASRVAGDLGADATLVVSPAYIRPSQAGIAEHYEAIADESGLPVIAYNVPCRTSSDIEPETLGRLSHHDRIIGVKEASGSILRMQQVLAAVQGRMAVLSGDDPLTLSLLVAGGQGVISTCSNIAPKHWVALWDAWQAGDIARASQIQAQLLGLHEALFMEANPGPVKAAAHLLGLIEPEIRSPMTWPGPDTVKRLATELNALGLTPGNPT
jgi:4-hydroxy-tetrahydrodipicolinate synthase